MKIPKIKKEISLFLNSEEAKVLRKNVAKIGFSAAVLAAIMAQIDSANAGHDSGPHSNHNSMGHSSYGVYNAASRQGGHHSAMDTPTHSDEHTDHDDHGSDHSDGSGHTNHTSHGDGETHDNDHNSN